MNVLEVFNSNCAPRCDRENCFAYADGKCRVLTDNRFKRGCPFYKDKKEKEIEDARCKERSEKGKKNRPNNT